MSNHISKHDARKAFFAMCDRLDLAPKFSNTTESLAAIRAAAMRLSNLGEKECNGVPDPANPRCMKWDDADQARNDKARAVAESKVTTALQSCLDAGDFARLQVEFQGDPRGPSVIIHERGGLQRLATFW